MTSLLRLTVLLLAALPCGCASFQVAGAVQKGRYALLSGEPEAALTHFQRAAQINPDYIYNHSILQQSVWTYVGRAHYNAGNLTEAREALRRARSVFEPDRMAQLYLGLTLARGQDRRSGLNNIESGISGLYDWLEWIDFYTRDGKYWDPGRRLRHEMQKDLEMIAGKDIDWPQLVASTEWLGQKFEEEIDRARYDKSLHRRKHDRFHRLSRR
ncbi:MAG: tetratricopeptide repeat protein [Candidatus Binatia bacterium]